MNGDMEMHLKSQDIDLMQRDEPLWLLRFLPLGQRWTAPTFSRPTSGPECAHPGPIAIWPPGNADMPSHRDKSYGAAALLADD